MKAKRSLGQNFFINKNLCKQITDLILQENPDVLVEIGPGKGFFTDFLSKGESKMLLIEKDNVLSAELSFKFPDIEIKSVDFLEWNLDELDKYKGEKILFFGSLPYNVSKPIIRKIIKSKYFNTSCYFIIQKEVADKYISREPDNNILSLQTQLNANVKRYFNISPESFRPKPKVNSSFIKFSPKENMPIENSDSFEKFIQICFKQPRKTLKNNLRKVSFQESSKVDNLLSKRPQQISLNEYLLLFSNLKDLLI